MQQRIVWERLDAPGLELLDLRQDTAGVQAEGTVVTALPREVFRLTYRVVCDAAWRFREAGLTVTQGGQERRLQIAHGGGWTVDGRSRPDLEGCVDIDIMASPFTNSLPVRRAPPAPGETRRYRMAYIVVPELTVGVDEQEYTHLGGGRTPSRIRYHGLGSGFVAAVALDTQGLVTDYEGLWRRR